MKTTKTAKRKTTRKTAKKTSTRKAKGTGRTAKTTRASSKSAGGSVKRKPARTRTGKTAVQPARVAKEKLALLEQFEALGLLDTPASETLNERLEELRTAETYDPSLAAGIDRTLTASLAGFQAAGGDKKQLLSALLAWQNAASFLPDDEEGITQAVTLLRKVVPFAGATLFVRDPDNQRVRPLITVGREVDLIGRIRFTEGMGFASWVATRRKPVLYGSIHRNLPPGEEHVRSFMSVPLVLGGECVAVLNVGHAEENAYDQSALRALILAGGSLAGILQRFVSRAQILSREIREKSTELATRGYLTSRLAEEVTRCRELGHSMSLLVFRLNEMETFGEQFGEDFRERTRQEFASLLREWRNPTELVGHGAGETLVVLCPSVRREHAEERARLLAERVQKHNFPRRKKMTVSVGISTYPSDAEDPQELLGYADKALSESARVTSVTGPGGVPLAA